MIENIESDPDFWAILFEFGRRGISRGDKIIKSMWSTNYHRYLQSKPWKIKSDNAKVMADHKCQLCYSPDGLETHHRTYDRLGEEKISDLIVLCSACHKKHHRVE